MFHLVDAISLKKKKKEKFKSPPLYWDVGKIKISGKLYVKKKTMTKKKNTIFKHG